METATVLRDLRLRLDQTDLADLPGRLLYSGVGTLKPGPIYLLGWNPGGDPDVEPDTPAEHLEKLERERVDWNEYLDGYWRPGGRVLGKGQAPMQKRVVHLLQGIGVEPRTICASNLIFMRSRGKDGLSQGDNLVRRCWLVHDFLLGIVRPKIVLSIGGNAVLDALLRKGAETGGRAAKASGHADWECQSVRARLGQHQVRIVSVPHLSRYAIDHHPDVVRWVRDQIAA